jgi:biopolymer transport protein ExbD
MAEIDSSQGGGKGGGKVRSKKASTKVDMTPMVDLAFLLITFFMLATTLSKPQAMQLNMPDKNDKNDDVPKIKNTESMTLIIGEKNKLYYYTDVEKPELLETNYSAKGARRLFNEGNALTPKFTILVKPLEKSNYKNLVDILDELDITKSRFAVVDPSPQDIQLVLQKEGVIPADAK